MTSDYPEILPVQNMTRILLEAGVIASAGAPNQRVCLTRRASYEDPRTIATALQCLQNPLVNILVGTGC